MFVQESSIEAQTYSTRIPPTYVTAWQACSLCRNLDCVVDYTDRVCWMKG